MHSRNTTVSAVAVVVCLGRPFSSLTVLRRASLRSKLVFGVVVTLLLLSRPVRACTGGAPNCAARGLPCDTARCDPDSGWVCDVPVAVGGACTDNNLCTTGDHCDGNGSCVATNVNCTITNGGGSCAPASGACSYTCNAGYQLWQSTCVPNANATITLSTIKTTTGTTGLMASVPAQTGASYAWTIAGGGAIVAGQNTSSLTFSATATPSATVSVTVTSAANQHASNSATISIYAPPVATITAPSHVTEGWTLIDASVADQPGSTYAWTTSTVPQ